MDCLWGPTTRSAVKLFQNCNSVADDGIVGRKTWGLMVDANVTAAECFP
ncbi:MAG: peptidoglycan-binding protein [Acidimicrobiia bacterium]